MRAGQSNLEEFLGAILRGAAKILGCTSTNLILVNERTQEMRVQLGVMVVSYPLLEEIEHVVGNSFNGISVPIHRAQDSLIYKAWRDRSIHETSSALDLIGSAFPRELIRQVERMIGELRFICVPAQSVSRNYGVLLFTKEGRHPFSRQQREVLLRYARRIGEIVESQGQNLVTQISPSGPAYLLFDGSGQVMGETPGNGSELRLLAVGETMVALAREARDFASAEGDLPPRRARPAPGLSVELNRFSLGGETGVLCALHHEGAQADRSLENQLLQLTLGDTAPALFLDPEFNITSCNEAAEQVLGYDATDLLRRPISMLFREPREILDILGHQILFPDTPYSTESAMVVHADGTLSPSRVEALLLANDRRQVVGFLVLIREPAADETDSAGRWMVQERLASMGEMATQLAHEIRNPLVAIGATLEGLGREETLGEDQRAVVASMAREIDRMDMILRDYLAARRDVAMAEVNVSELLEDARRLLQGARRAAGKRITVSIPPDLTILADYDAIRHVFFNLLLNALEASATGGEVTCRATTGEHDVSIFIEDRGPGLGADASRCFQPFFTTKKNGTGLGLAVCQKMARAHGGLVALRDREGGGCQASLVLPRRRGQAAGRDAVAR